MRIPSECSQTRSTAKATRQPANLRRVMGYSGKFREREGRSRLQPFEICTTRYPQAICFQYLTFVHLMSANAQQHEPLAPTFSSAIVDARNYMDWIVATLRPYFGQSVLEVGIGHGSYYEYLGKLGRYHGIDIDPANVEGARARFPGGDFALADICSD